MAPNYQRYKYFLSLLYFIFEAALKGTWFTNLRGHNAPNKQQKSQRRQGQYKFRSEQQQQESFFEYVGSMAKYIFFPHGWV